VAEALVSQSASARHDTDVVSLVAGLLFLGIAGSWVLDRAALLPGSRGWLLPLVLVGAGVVGLFSARARRRDLDATEPADLALE